MRALLLIIFCTLFFNCNQPQRNCENYKTGSFEFIYTIDGIEKKGQFIRTDTLNIDFYEGKIDSASIRWINDCEFIQKKINPKSMKEDVAIHMKIISTTSNTYTFEYSEAAPYGMAKKRIERGTVRRVSGFTGK